MFKMLENHERINEPGMRGAPKEAHGRPGKETAWHPSVIEFYVQTIREWEKYNRDRQGARANQTLGSGDP